MSERPSLYMRKPSQLSPVALTVLAAIVATVARPGAGMAGWGGIDPATGRARFQVAYRYSPTYSQIAETQASLTRMAQIVCDATDGQVRIAEIRLTSSPADEAVAGFWLHGEDAASGGAYFSDGSGLRRLGSHSDVFLSAAARPDRLAHLFAHHAFGLGDQYDDQRRRGSACGVGPGFEPGVLDERRHSLMQLSGGMRCHEGALAGESCSDDAECGGSACVAVLASEFSVASDHDQLRAEGGTCPRPQAVSRISLRGLLPRNAEPMAPFDATDFLTARGSSSWNEEIQVVGPGGEVAGLRLFLYLTHLAPLSWQLSIAIDEGDVGGEPGRLRLVKAWKLRFNEDLSLNAIDPPKPSFRLPTRPNAEQVDVAVDVGTANPAVDSGIGFDGLQMITAGKVRVAVTSDGVPGCTSPTCDKSWNGRTGRWETSEQSLMHAFRSDWETLAVNYRFLRPPADLPSPEPAEMCSSAPTFINDVMGVDQVVLVLDTSLSMGATSNQAIREVCENHRDDDADGETDETACASSRLDFARMAADVFLSLEKDADTQVGIVSMQTDAEIVAEVADMTAARATALSASLASLTADGETALGTALERAHQSLARVERLGRSRTVVLLTDGVQNVGVEPGKERTLLHPSRMRVFGVGLGASADMKALSVIAARSGGVAMSAASAMDLPGMYAELAARRQGQAMLLERTAFSIARPGGARPSGTTIPAARELSFQVEEQAGELVVYLGTRNSRIRSWGVLFELVGPGGARYDERSAATLSQRGFHLVRISDPRPGAWRLRVLPSAPGQLDSEAMAFVRNDRIDLFADVEPRLATTDRPVTISAVPLYVTDLDNAVTVGGSVRRPDGSEVPLAVSRDPFTGSWWSRFDQFAGRGFYEVRITTRVGDGARPSVGERIFEGPARLPVRVVPFERTIHTSFYLDHGSMPSCATNDCDGDGIGNVIETRCGDDNDSDGDGVPNRHDTDSDNDELLDWLEGTRDADSDGLADFCDPKEVPTSLDEVTGAQEKAIELACSPEGAASVRQLEAALSAVRRILQTVRTKGSADEQRRQALAARLENVVALQKKALIIGEVLPDFCQKYQSNLREALAIESEIRNEVDAILAP
ncbi:MAG TPA: vWA domain-containing protein [Candidatus Binatia bacterium]|nr:vWA domain-containing protein [Candidatus Binatia bacterium]